MSLDRLNAHPLPFAKLLGIEFVSTDPDAVSARMVVRPDLCTLGGFAHGGAIMSFADTLGGAAAFLNLPTATKARRRCVLVHRGRRTQVWQIRVETDVGKLVALFVQTQMTL